MKLKEFNTKINELGLSLCWDIDGKNVSVGKPKIANPMLWFNPYIEEKDYDGSVKVKSINAPLFTGEQIRKTLILVDEFLMTQLDKREL